MNTVQKFLETTGLYANQSKSQLYIVGVTRHTQDAIIRITRFTKGEFPIKYLGVPLSPRKWTNVDCSALVETLVKRIKCWSSRHLFFAGRL